MVGVGVCARNAEGAAFACMDGSVRGAKSVGEGTFAYTDAGERTARSVVVAAYVFMVVTRVSAWTAVAADFASTAVELTGARSAGGGRRKKMPRKTCKQAKRW
mmetsp:Transcript_2981/g.6097  ORF Transcript_2981/g.6097 Transcript_2981/m.6097 type:complete len:103 (+) Transcript_2981:443-751(+)